MKRKKSLHVLLTAIFISVLVLGSSRPASAQTANPVSMTGWFSIIWGDSSTGEQVANPIYTLTDDSGQATLLTIDETLAESVGGILAIDRQRITIEGALAGSLSDEVDPTPLQVTAIALAPLPRTASASANVSAVVSGSRPFISILCKFSDLPAYEPNNLAFFQNMYSNVNPRLDHYWREQSYDLANVAGSSAINWVTLPQPKSYYNPTNTRYEANLNLLATDCTTAADSSVDFSLYQNGGINMMFNDDFDNGVAWGGGKYFTLDGVTQVWPITWEPPWSYADISVIEHEMGHAFGLPHSSYGTSTAYDNAWDVMSKDRYNCPLFADATYGCKAQHTISYHKDILGWIPADKKYTAPAGVSTITLEQLALPTTSNYLMAQIPIGGSSTHFYTVEARRQTGYDNKVFGNAVIIHDVLTTRSNGRPAYVIDGDGNGTTSDVGTMWTATETYTDATNGISVEVLSATATGFQIRITTPTAPTTLVNSVLPTSRTPVVGNAVTIFNTVINAGADTAYGITLSMNPAPAGTFVYQQTNCATNAIIGSPNPSLDLASGGVLCYVLSFTPSATFAATNVHIRALATNAPTTNLLTGINTWLLRSTVVAGPDIIALTTTVDFHQVACSGANAFAVALSNVGAAATGDITAVANTGSASLPLSISISETNPGTGAIIGDNILQSVGAGANRTVAVFVTFNGCVSFDPAANRVFIEFRDASNNVIGSTSTAVSTNR